MSVDDLGRFHEAILDPRNIFQHGARGVRANVVGTEIATAPELLLGLAPPLPSFPGTVDQQVAGAVRLLLSPDASGITGTLVRADSGRAW